MGNALSRITASLIASCGVFSLTRPAHRVSICTFSGVNHLRTSGFLPFIYRNCPLPPTSSGRIKSFFGRVSWAKSINLCQMRALDSIPLARALACFPSVFPVQTAVVYCGVYPIVQRSLGRVLSHTFLLDVPVFTAAFRPFISVRK